MLKDRESMERVARKGVAAFKAVPAKKRDVSDNDGPYAIVEHWMYEIGKSDFVELLVTCGELDEAIEVARKLDLWITLGTAAAKDETQLNQLEQRLNGSDSNVAKALVCKGVVDELLERKKKTALPMDQP